MKVNINDNVFKCKVCSSVDSITKGMMNQTFNHNFDGMIFIMPMQFQQQFWMYNCLIPLDIIMIDGDTITKINHYCEPCEIEEECEFYSGYGDKVLEIAGGKCKELGIKEGDKVKTSLY